MAYNHSLFVKLLEHKIENIYVNSWHFKWKLYKQNSYGIENVSPRLGVEMCDAVLDRACALCSFKQSSFYCFSKSKLQKLAWLTIIWTNRQYLNRITKSRGEIQIDTRNILRKSAFRELGYIQMFTTYSHQLHTFSHQMNVILTLVCVDTERTGGALKSVCILVFQNRHYKN